MNTIEVFGNHGSLTVELEYGLVIDRVACTECYHDASGVPDGSGCVCEGYDVAVKFDITEFRAAYPNERIEGMHVDILDIGSWDREGVYEPAEPSYRNHTEAAGGGPAIEAHELGMGEFR